MLSGNHTTSRNAPAPPITWQGDSQTFRTCVTPAASSPTARSGFGNPPTDRPCVIRYMESSRGFEQPRSSKGRSASG